MKSVLLQELPKECPICGEHRAAVSIGKKECLVAFECELQLSNTKIDEPEFLIVHDCKNATLVGLNSSLPKIDNKSIEERTKAAHKLNANMSQELEEFQI